MSKIQQPVQSIKMTNVAIVRYKCAGKRFEIACYKNKVMNWRNKIEKDLSEVLQSNYIFTNVSKGVSSNNADLMLAFGTTDFTTIAVEILAKGEVQISEKERAAELESKFKDIAGIVSEKCINAETRRPFSIGMIERSMRELHFSVKQNRTTKQQALELIKELKAKAVLPIERAQMRIKVEVALHAAKALKPKLLALASSVESEEYTASNLELLLLIDPGAYRSIEEMLAREAKGKFALDILDLKVQLEGEAALENEEAEQEMRALGLDQRQEQQTHAQDEEDVEELAARASNIKLTGHSTDDEDAHRGKRKGPKGKKQQAAQTQASDDEHAAAHAKGKKGKKGKKGAAAAAASDSDSDNTAMRMAPKKKKQSAAQKKALQQQQAAAAAAARADSDSESDSDSDSEPAAPRAKAKAAAPKKKAAAVSSDSESSSESSSEEEEAPRKKPAPKKKKAVVSSSSESESESDSAPAATKPAKPAAAAAAAAPRKPPPRKKRRGSDSDEEEIRVPNQSQIDAEEREEAEAAARAKAAAAAAKKASGQAKPDKKAKKKAAAVASSDDSDDEIAVAQIAKKKTKQKKKGKQTAADSDSD